MAGALPKGKDFSGYSKLEQKPFSEDGFKEPEAIVFDGDDILSIFQKVKGNLDKINKAYAEIAKLYGEALKCTASGKTMDSSTADGKTINNLKKKASARATVMATRSTQMQNKIDALQMQLDAINAANTKTNDDAGKDIAGADENESD